MKRVYAFLLLFCSVHSAAQSVTPVARMEGVSPELVSAMPAAPFEPLAPRNSFVARSIPSPARPRTFDRTFALLATVSAAMMVADVELTANCVKTVANCREANPLFGSDPSRARLYGVNVPIYAGEVLLSQILRRKFPERKSWMRPFLSLTGAHGVGVVSGLRAR
jgi:hypothetical protein